MPTAIEEFIVGLLQQILATLLGQAAANKNQAVEHVPYFIETTVETIDIAVNSGPLGLAGINTKLDNLSTDLLSARLAILAAIAGTQQAANPVILPTIPPTGYGGLDAGATGLAVWNYADFVTGHTTLQDLSIGTNVLSALAQEAMITSRGADYFYLLGAFATYYTDGGPTRIPTPDASHILITDTLLTWLTREEPTITWVAGFFGGDAVGGDDPSGHWTWICRLSPADWLALYETYFPAPAGANAPTWPGIAHVTLGTALALSDGLLIPGPLHGVLVHISSVPVPISYYPFGPVKSYVRAGAVVFVDDNGDAEFPAPLGPDHLVICPRAMFKADHAYLRLPSGVTGTITPWIRV